MTTGVPVVKTNGTGNTFVLVDERLAPLDDPAAFARRVCDPAGGLGADGVLVVGRSDLHDARMRIFNADGSEAEMCGNGMRCVARYLDECDGVAAAIVETVAGPIGTRILARDPYRVAVEVAEPRIGARFRLGRFDVTSVEVGNPHAVVELSDEGDVELEVDGPRIERDPHFAHGTNVHFIRYDAGAGRWRVRHWERGAGATAACGTGCVAVAAVLIARGEATSPVTLLVPGGELEVRWTPGEPATLIGDAVREFERVLA